MIRIRSDDQVMTAPSVIRPGVAVGLQCAAEFRRRESHRRLIGADFLQGQVELPDRLAQLLQERVLLRRLRPVCIEPAELTEENLASDTQRVANTHHSCDRLKLLSKN